MNTTRTKRRLSALEAVSPSSLVEEPVEEHHSLATDGGCNSSSKTLRRSSSGPLLIFSCNLPPTCNPPGHSPTVFSSSAALEAHHRSHHAFVCADQRCSRFFPSQHFLDLHLDEVHNPLLLLKQQKLNSKIFRCFDPRCKRTFTCPKKRRLHLIDHHGYPTTFFFSLPNQGLNELFHKYGDGVSLIRPDWKSKENPIKNLNKIKFSTTLSSLSSLSYKSNQTFNELIPNHQDNQHQVQVNQHQDQVNQHQDNVNQHQDQDHFNSINKFNHSLNNQKPLDSFIDSFNQLSFVPRQVQFSKNNRL